MDELFNTTEELQYDTTDSLGDLASANETSSRSGKSREQLALKRGANRASEEAVELALKWIVDHQLPDGGWDLDHTKGPNPKRRSSPNPGTMTDARFGATALALLPLLGAGSYPSDG